MAKIEHSYSKSSDTGFLMIIFPDHQEELEAPYSIMKHDNFYSVEGINNDQLVTFIIPDDVECYFEVRQDLNVKEKPQVIN